MEFETKSVALATAALVAFGFLGLSAEGAVNGRFVRLDRNGDKGPRMIVAEIRAFVGCRNVALAGRPDMAGAYGNARRAPAKALTDGRESWRWVEPDNNVAETTGNGPHWMEVDLFEEMPLDRIEILGGDEKMSVKVLSADRKVVWEAPHALPKNRKPTDPPLGRYELAPGCASRQIGQVVPRQINAVSPSEYARYYTKGADWLDTLCKTCSKLQWGWQIEEMVPFVLQDFPESREFISAELVAAERRPQEMMTPAQWARGILHLLPREKKDGLEKKLKAGEIRTSKDVLPYFEGLRRNDGSVRARMRLMFHLFDPAALARAIRAYAKKWPDRYDGEALLAELEAVKPAALEAHRLGREDAGAVAVAEALENLYRKVYANHPAVDFKEILMVRRARARLYKGLPANFAGNSSIPLFGYVNDIVRVPLFQSPGARPRVVYETGVADRHAFLGDVKLDYDAKRILYSSGDGTAPNWGVYETELDRPGTRTRLTPKIADIDYYDPCYLPDGGKLVVATSGFQGVPCVGGNDYVGNLHLLGKDGSIRRLAFDQDNSWNPIVLPSGRVLYQRWEYTDSAHYFARLLMTMYPDGTGQQEFYGSNSYWPNCMFNVRPIPGSPSKFVGIVTGHHYCERSGDLVIFDASRGTQEAAGAVQTIPGWGHPVEPVSKDRLVEGHAPFFRHPFPLSDELFLCSANVDEWWSASCIVLADVYDNVVPIWTGEHGLQLFEPIPLKATPRPPIAVSRSDPSKRETTLMMVDANFGPGLRGVPAGTVKKLRVYQYDYSPRNYGGHYCVGFEGPWDLHIPLGTVDVEEDGSCFFAAPANTPLAIQPLDKDGKALQQMRSWTTGMPGEHQSCVGCHERMNTAAPPRRVTAMTKPVQKIKPWYGPRRGFSFEREVQPVLDRRCAACHNPDAKAKTKQGAKIPDFATARLATNAADAVRGDFSVSYLNLHPYVRRNGPEGDYHVLTPLEFHTDTSELFQLLEKGHHGVKLDAEETDRLVTWVDLNVPYWGTWPEVMWRPNPRYRADTLDRRLEMAKKYAGDDFDARTIVNPYTNRVAAVRPAKEPPPVPAPRLAGWPVDASDARRRLQRARQPAVYELGNFEKLRFVYVPEGKFVMGSNDETPAERPMHVAEVKTAFRLTECEITVGQYRQFDPAHDNGVYDMHNKDQVRRGYFVNDEAKFPAIRVSWERANEFCAWLSKRTGRTCRLPTETEWEWACRAGTATPMNYGALADDFSARENLADASLVKLAVSGIDPQPVANPPPILDYELRERRSDDGVVHLAKVGSYRPNAWGLRDMHGNVAEWTASDWTADYAAPSAGGDLKVVRGGSWYRRPQVSTSSWRWRYPKWMQPFDVGFRVVMEEPK